MEYGEVQKVVGSRVKLAREHQEVSQNELCGLLAPYVLGKWSRAVVSRAEGGGRAFQAHELLALSLVLERPVGWLLTPVQGSTVQVGEKTVSKRQLQRVGVTDGRGEPSSGAALGDFLRASSADLTSQAVDMVNLSWALHEASMKLASDANALAKGPKG
jgi:hypothetical protein